MPNTETTQVQLAVMNTQLTGIGRTLKRIEGRLDTKEVNDAKIRVDCNKRFGKIETSQAVTSTKVGFFSFIISAVVNGIGIAIAHFR